MSLKAGQSRFTGIVVAALLSCSFCLAQVVLPSPAATHGNLRLTFEANRGQSDAQVKFLARGAGYTVFLTSGQMVLELRPSAFTSDTPHNSTNTPLQQPNVNLAAINAASRPLNQKTGRAVIQINLVDADRNPGIAGEDPQPGKVNYFIGNDLRKWKTNVPTYGQVRYRNVYPGIDVVYYGNQSRLEHDFVIAPGANPDRIQLDVRGTDSVSVASKGDLILSKGDNEIRLQAPVLYQEFQGTRIPVSGQYTVKDATRVSFTIGPYDRTMPLVIDPVLVYGTFVGGSGSTQAYGIGVDSTGNAYLAGCTDSPTFPLAPTKDSPIGVGAFVAKLDVSGSSLVYADFIGGNGYTRATAMTLNGSNNALITGYTSATNFPTVNPYQATNKASGNAAFVTEVSADGSSLIYSTYLSGRAPTRGSAIGLDSVGDFYVSGSTSAADYPTVNAYQPTVSANQANQYGTYGFLTKFAPGGASLVYSTYYAGSTTFGGCGGTCYPAPSTFVTGMAVDASGNAYVTGQTNTFNFPVTPGAYQTTNATSYNVTVGLIGRFSPSGTLLYSSYYGATATNSWGLLPTAIAFDASGSSYVVGTTYYGGNPIPVTASNLCDPSQTTCDNGFISKFDPTGASIIYSTYLSPTIDAGPRSVVVDASGDAYVYSQSSGGPVTSLLNPIEAYTDGEDVFLQEIDPNGGTLFFSTFVGGTGDDFPGGMAVDPAGDIYISGYTNSSDYPVTSGAFQQTLGGSSDAFVARIAANAAPAVSLGPSSIQFPSLAVGSVSQRSTSLLRNMGSAPLTIASITTTGDFSEIDTCGSGVTSAGTCTFTITFSPTQAGLRSGSITIVDTAAGSPHVIRLSGNGVAGPMVSLAPSSLTFSSLQVNQTSPPQNVTLTNTGNATLSISSVETTGPFAQTNNCPTSLVVGSSCTLRVTVTPISTGTQNGSLSVTDSASGNPQSVTLVGYGIDFRMPTSGGSSTITPGATASYQFSIRPVGGAFSSAISFACAGLPAFSTCAINPNPVTLGTNNVSVTVAITTAGNKAQLFPEENTRHGSFFAVWALTSGLGLFGMFTFGAGKRTHRFGLLLSLVAATVFCTSCIFGSNAAHSTPPGAYTVMVVGTSGSTHHSTLLSLTVQ